MGANRNVYRQATETRVKRALTRNLDWLYSNGYEPSDPLVQWHFWAANERIEGIRRVNEYMSGGRIK